MIRVVKAAIRRSHAWVNGVEEERAVHEEDKILYGSVNVRSKDPLNALTKQFICIIECKVVM